MGHILNFGPEFPESGGPPTKKNIFLESNWGAVQALEIL